MHPKRLADSFDMKFAEKNIQSSFTMHYEKKQKTMGSNYIVAHLAENL